MPKPLVTDIDSHIGARLRKLRQQEGISAAALAEAIGSTQQQISRYENGQNKLGAAQLYRFSQYLGMPISWFFLGVDEETPEWRIRDNRASYKTVVVKEELDALEAIWPRLSSTKRNVVLTLLDTFLSE
jgi:transcriptional regulator with XRE-family HTH domain